MYRRILIPTDGSECSDKAVETGVALAKTLDAEVIFLYVIENPYLATESPEWAERHSELETELTQMADNALGSASAQAEAQGVTAITATESFARPQDVIIEMADRYDLIVMGTHGRTGWRKVIIGSVTERVLHRSTKPVMVIPCRSVDMD